MLSGEIWGKPLPDSRLIFPFAQSRISDESNVAFIELNVVEREIF
jgi:hypothetical protein